MADLDCAATDNRLDECKMWDGADVTKRAASFGAWINVEATSDGNHGGGGNECANAAMGAYVECDTTTQMSWADRFNMVTTTTCRTSTAIAGARAYGDPITR